jgi:hypothetical protein
VAGTGGSRSRNRLVGDIGGALTKSGAPAVCPRAGQRSASPIAADPIAVLPPDRGRRPAMTDAMRAARSSARWAVTACGTGWARHVRT